PSRRRSPSPRARASIAFARLYSTCDHPRLATGSGVDSPCPLVLLRLAFSISPLAKGFSADAGRKRPRKPEKRSDGQSQRSLFGRVASVAHVSRIASHLGRRWHLSG